MLRQLRHGDSDARTHDGAVPDGRRVRSTAYTNATHAAAAAVLVCPRAGNRRVRQRRRIGFRDGDDADGLRVERRQHHRLDHDHERRFGQRIGLASNTDPADRTGSIRVADRTFVIEQAGNVGGCEYAVSPVQFSPCMDGGTLTATITTRQNCPWSAVADGSWLVVPDGASRSGPGTIAIAYSDNYDAPRQGLILVRWPTPTAGQNIRVAQAGCLYGVTRTDFSFAAAGGTGTFDVLQQSEPIVCGGATQDRCLWTARSDAPWITITTSMPRTGDDRVAFVVAPNDGATARTGRITVRDKVIAVTQSGR